MINKLFQSCSILLCGMTLTCNCFAATAIVSIPTNSVDIMYTPTGYSAPVTISGHGASGAQTVPGWTWNYTGNYSDPRYPMYMSTYNSSYACLGPQTGISLPYDCDSNDNLTATSGDDYPGYEFHYFVFELPAGAQSPRINFNALGSDDRAVVTLNGHELGNLGSAATDQPHLGPSGPETRTFTNPFTPLTPDIWFDEPSIFQPGPNVLRMWVNNTGSGGFGTATTHAIGNPSGSVVRGILTYEYEELSSINCFATVDYLGNPNDRIRLTHPSESDSTNGTTHQVIASVLAPDGTVRGTPISIDFTERETVVRTMKQIFDAAGLNIYDSLARGNIIQLSVPTGFLVSGTVQQGSQIVPLIFRCHLTPPPLPLPLSPT